MLQLGEEVWVEDVVEETVRHMFSFLVPMAHEPLKGRVGHETHQLLETGPAGGGLAWYCYLSHPSSSPPTRARTKCPLLRSQCEAPVR